jgi:uncharacterized phage protein gp47/JayE
MNYICCGENRKAAILGDTSLNLNGIDYLEVLDYNTLVVHCLRTAPSALTPANIIIEGGESITGVSAQWVAPASPPPPLATSQEQTYFAGLADAANVLVVRTTQVGDFSTYTLRLVNNVLQAREDPFKITAALSGFDPQLAQVEFSFRVECGTDFDCLPQPAICPPPAITPPPINYLAKDYGTFRTVMLDRMNQLLPNWNASTEADLGVALAELIAYAGDQLSYRQDAIATEAYLETARSRISLRRHALLVDYRVHDGCNARVWVQFKLRQDSPQVLLERDHTVISNKVAGMPAVLANNEGAALLAGAQLFEPVHDAVLFLEHNQMSFYTWGETDCCLPTGATEATLAGAFPNLKTGDVLIFQEVKGPLTGIAGDADMRHRCAVRLTQVATLLDPVFGAAPVTEIQWSSGDALPFPICLSATVPDSNGSPQAVTDVSVALGNVVLADHGLSVSGIDLGTVPAPRLFYPAAAAGDRCTPSSPIPLPVRFRPAVPDSPVTQAVPYALAGSPVTPGVTMLQANGVVILNDSTGIASLRIQPADLSGWPLKFGMTVKANGANFDLAVIYNAATPVVVESLTGLSLNNGDPNYAVTQINSLSKFILIPSTYKPPAAPPSSLPSAPVQLQDAGTDVDFKDTNGVTWLTVQATDPTAWASSFGVIAKSTQRDPAAFNLALVYKPPSGVGVSPPVTVEQFDNVSLADFQLISLIFADSPNASLSANDLMNFDPADALPVISLEGTLNTVSTIWTPRQDLLEDDATSPGFVVEVESNGVATLRFGDDTNGRNPEQNTSFTASYRIGNGTAGNLGAESLTLFAAAPGIACTTNPLPASGGTDSETNDQIRRRAPQAFQTQERAVTMPDYEALAESNPQVNQAVATPRWTGSWYTVFLAAEPRGGGALPATLETSLQTNLERYRLAGQDLQLQSPWYVSLEIELQVEVDPNYFRGHVKQSLLAILGNGLLPDGRKGLFYPDSFTLGQTVYLSPIYAAARSVAGVLSVMATSFQPQGVNTTQYLTAGEIKLGSFQLARLENDPSLPDHGQLTLVMEGGK